MDEVKADAVVEEEAGAAAPAADVKADVEVPAKFKKIVEEIEKMERGWLRSLYEDHFAVYSAIWTIAVIAIGVLLNVGARHLLEGDRTPPPIIVNVPEQKPPIVNIVIPEPKAKVP